MMDLAFYLRDYSLSKTAMLIYGVLDGLSSASKKRGKDYVYISRKSLASRVGVCERTARTAVKQLATVGLIAVKRRGLGLNDNIFVFSPKTKTQPEEKEKKVKDADLSVYSAVPDQQKDAIPDRQKSVIPNINTQSENITNSVSQSINPTSNDNKGQAMPTRKPIPKKKFYRNVRKRKEREKEYREYLIHYLKFKEFEDMVISSISGFDSLEALEGIIDLMSSAMASDKKISVNGVLLSPEQWWNIAKTITQEGAFNVINKYWHARSIRNSRAYLLAMIYNEAIKGKIFAPFC